MLPSSPSHGLRFRPSIYSATCFSLFRLSALARNQLPPTGRVHQQIICMSAGLRRQQLHANDPRLRISHVAFDGVAHPGKLGQIHIAFPLPFPRTLPRSRAMFDQLSNNRSDVVMIAAPINTASRYAVDFRNAIQATGEKANMVSLDQRSTLQFVAAHAFDLSHKIRANMRQLRGKQQ